jgi:hypothetical protein
MQILLAMKKIEQHGALLYSLTFAQQDDSLLISGWHNVSLGINFTNHPLHIKSDKRFSEKMPNMQIGIHYT